MIHHARAAKARWKKYRRDVRAAKQGDAEAAERVARWKDSIKRRQPTTPGLSRGEDGRYRLEQLPGQSWATRQGAHQALERHRKKL